VPPENNIWVVLEPARRRRLSDTVRAQIMISNVYDKLNKLLNSESISIGGLPKDNSISLCIYSKDINPENLTKVIGCQPSNAKRKGEIDSRHPNRPPAKIGIWCLDTPENLPFIDKLKYLLTKTTSELSVWETIHKSHTVSLRCVVYLHSWSEGFDISHELLSEIGNRKWEFGLAMYSAEGEEIIDSFLKKP